MKKLEKQITEFQKKYTLGKRNVYNTNLRWTNILNNTGERKTSTKLNRNTKKNKYRKKIKVMKHHDRIFDFSNNFFW